MISIKVDTGRLCYEFKLRSKITVIVGKVAVGKQDWYRR
jgi:hypothetical protein